MSKALFLNRVIVKRSNIHGRGVFADKTIKKGELIEECHTLFTRGGDDVLEDYYFDAGRGKYAMPTGYGIIYNHSEDPNADYTFDKKRNLMRFKAARTIKKGEEIFVSYGDKWFQDRGFDPR